MMPLSMSTSGQDLRAREDCGWNLCATLPWWWHLAYTLCGQLHCVFLWADAMSQDSILSTKSIKGQEFQNATQIIPTRICRTKHLVKDLRFSDYDVIEFNKIILKVIQEMWWFRSVPHWTVYNCHTKVLKNIGNETYVLLKTLET